MPQPIDPSSELGRLSAAERVQHMIERNAQLAQLRAAEISGDDTRRMQEQVAQTEQKQQEVDAELRRRNPFMRYRKRKDAEQEHDGAADTYDAHQKRDLPDGEGQGLDVSL